MLQDVPQYSPIYRESFEPTTLQPSIAPNLERTIRTMQLYDSAVQRIKRDLTEGDSSCHTEGDSSDFTLDNRDSAVQPIRRDCTEGDSSKFTLDEQGTLFFNLLAHEDL